MSDKPHDRGLGEGASGETADSEGVRNNARSWGIARLLRAIRRRPLPVRDVMSRRWFGVQGLGLLTGGALVASGLLRTSMVSAESGGPPIRPPTADHDDAVFRQKCIRCGLCGTVCENGCIRFFGIDELEHGLFTPHLDVRRRSCTLCMRCTNICPTGALSPVADDLDAIADTVRMGTARVDPDRCISYLGRVCGYCHDACPLPQRAIRLAPPARPVVIEDGCVGCGRCVELCPQNPTAIWVEPGGGL